MMISFRNNLEKDFEFFVKNIGKLEPAEFCGLAKILSISMVSREKVEQLNLSKEDLDAMGLDEKQGYVAELMVPMDVVLEKMMDRFLELPRRRRKEINQILRDAQRGR